MASLQEFIERGMSFFNGNLVAKSMFDEAQSQISSLEEKLKAAESARLTAETSLAEAGSRIKSLEGDVAAKDESISALTKDVANLKESAKSVDTSAAAKAAKIAAGAGIPAGAAPTAPAGGEAKTQAQLLEEFAAITDPKARGEFYEKHFASAWQKK